VFHPYFYSYFAGGRGENHIRRFECWLNLGEAELQTHLANVGNLSRYKQRGHKYQIDIAVRRVYGFFFVFQDAKTKIHWKNIIRRGRMALRSEKVNWHRVSNSAFKKTLLKHASSQIN